MTKSHVPMHNAPERVEMPKLTNGTPAPVQRPKRTRNPVSQIPSTRGRLTKKDKRDLSQPVIEAPSQKRGSQLRPSTSTKSPVHGIPNLNVPIEGPSSGNVMTHKYRGSQQSSREIKPKFIDSTQGEPKNIYKP